MIFEIVRKERIDELMQDFPVTRLHFIASDLYTNHIRQRIDEMDYGTFSLYLNTISPYASDRI